MLPFSVNAQWCEVTNISTMSIGMHGLITNQSRRRTKTYKAIKTQLSIRESFHTFPIHHCFLASPTDEGVSSILHIEVSMKTFMTAPCHFINIATAHAISPMRSRKTQDAAYPNETACRISWHDKTSIQHATRSQLDLSVRCVKLLTSPIQPLIMSHRIANGGPISNRSCRKFLHGQVNELAETSRSHPRRKTRYVVRH